MPLPCLTEIVQGLVDCGVLFHVLVRFDFPFVIRLRQFKPQTGAERSEEDNRHQDTKEQLHAHIAPVRLWTQPYRDRVVVGEQCVALKPPNGAFFKVDARSLHD